MSEKLFSHIFSHAPAAIGYAPGRIEFIGNHTDYNGGAVLGAAVDLGIEVCVAQRDDREIHLVTDETTSPVIASLEDLKPLTGSDSWVNYPLGVTSVLIRDGAPIQSGFEFALGSTLPSGAGMSSSAALELATACALQGLFGFELERAQMAVACRKAENEFVGVPCGILDQGVSAFGEKDHLVHIDCLTETYSRVPMPAGCHFWIFNSNCKHALLDSKYSERHRECGQAFEILGNLKPEVACLAHLSPEFVESHREKLDPAGYRRALHVTREHRRVGQATEALSAGDLARVGSLLTDSHHSSRDLFENSIPELDFLVNALAALPQVHGARLTGGGFGGAVMALTDESFSNKETTSITRDYEAAFGQKPTVFHTVTGDGARIRRP